jgi:hypothetical protein
MEDLESDISCMVLVPRIKQRSYTVLTWKQHKAKIGKPLASLWAGPVVVHRHFYILKWMMTGAQRYEAV